MDSFHFLIELTSAVSQTYIYIYIATGHVEGLMYNIICEKI